MASQLIPPGGGTWWGAYHGNAASLAAQQDWETGSQNIWGRKSTVYHVFHDPTATGPSTVEQAICAAGQGRYLLFNHDQHLYGTSPEQWFYANDVAAGNHDAYFNTLAGNFAAWGQPFWYVYQHEMDNANNRPMWQDNGQTAADYVAAFRHVKNIFTAQGATNAEFVWCVTGSNTSFDAGLYPGNAYVDWLSWDPYLFSSDTFSKPTNRWGLFYSWLNNQTSYIDTSKPKIFPEWGVDVTFFTSGNPPQYEQYILDTPNAAKVNNIQAVAFFDRNQNTIDSTPTAVSAFHTAGADPQFNPTAAAAGLVQFRGAASNQGNLNQGQVTVAIPNGVLGGDLLLLVYGSKSAAADTGGQGVISDPAGVTGWNQLSAQQSVSAGIGKAWWLVAPGPIGGASTAAGQNVTVAYTGDTQNKFSALSVAAWFGNATVNPLAVISTPSADSTSSIAHTMPTVNTTGDGSTLIASLYAGMQGGTTATVVTSLTASSGWTMRATSIEAATFHANLAVLDSTNQVAAGTGQGGATVTSDQPLNANFAWTVAITPASPTVTITTGTVGQGEATAPFTAATFAAAGGTGPYVWTVPSGSLPPGLALSSSGTLSGTPTAAGTYTYTLRADDQVGAFGTRQYTQTIIAGPSVTTVTPAAGTTGTAYSFQLTASGGATPYSWTLTAGPLPPGLALSASGLLSGTPTTAGTYPFTVAVTDVAGGNAAQALSIVVSAPGLNVTTSSLPGAEIGAAYSAALAAAGGTTPYTWALVAGSLPPGFTLSTGGVISGTPTALGASQFTVRVTDSAGTPATAQGALTLTVVAGPVVTTAALPGANAGQFYTANLAASGGVPPYTWGSA